MIRLVVARGVGEPATLQSSADLVRIGRADDCDLVLDAAHVSGRHAEIAFTGEAFVLRDEGSTNGTRVRRDGASIDVTAAQGREVTLVTGDRIELGERTHPVVVDVTITDDEQSATIVAVRDVSSAAIERVEAAVGSDRETLARLYDAQKDIAAALELDEVIEAVGRQVFALLPRATHTTIALRLSDAQGDVRITGPCVPMRSMVRGERAPAEAVPITRSIFQQVVARRAAVLAADAREEVTQSASLVAAQIRSTLGVPLWEGDAIVGVLQVDNRSTAGVFGPADLDVLALLAQSASQAVARARLLHRLRVAEARVRDENAYLKEREEHRRFDGIIGESAAMRAVFEQIEKVVDTHVTVLIEGETGTGKELVASALHYQSRRRDRLFVAQNCAALPENLLESELFGHKRGAFTGATADKKGLFELADGGTLFLDEVGEMPPALQPKLLRVLQEGEVRPLGSAVTRQVDVRIVAATNRDLEAEVRDGRFREDLYYRLRVFPIRLPPLRERRADIEPLAVAFLARHAAALGRPVQGFSQAAMELLESYDWRGNARELDNEVQRLVIELSDEAFVEPRHLSPRLRQAERMVGDARPTKGSLKEMVEQVEKWLLSEALREHDGNKTATAKALGITREGLHKKLRGYGMT